MLTILAIAALSQPLTLHGTFTPESRYVRACIACDYYVIDEQTGIIRYYQIELRRVIVFRDALEDFGEIGQHKFHLPAMAFDSPGMLLLCLKREIDEHNCPHRIYADTTDSHNHARFAGMIRLGSEATRAKKLKQPWKRGYQLTAFEPPRITK